MNYFVKLLSLLESDETDSSEQDVRRICTAIYSTEYMRFPLLQGSEWISVV